MQAVVARGPATLDLWIERSRVRVSATPVLHCVIGQDTSPASPLSTQGWIGPWLGSDCRCVFKNSFRTAMAAGLCASQRVDHELELAWIGPIAREKIVKALLHSQCLPSCPGPLPPKTKKKVSSTLVPLPWCGILRLYSQVVQSRYMLYTYSLWRLWITMEWATVYRVLDRK